MTFTLHFFAIKHPSTLKMIAAVSVQPGRPFQCNRGVLLFVVYLLVEG